MTTSGTFQYFPSTAELGLTAFSRIGVRRGEITTTHMQDLKNAANLLMAEFSNLQPNLWTVGLTSVTLTPGQSTYSVDPSVVMILDMYISYGTPTYDRLIFPISRTEYASYPNKNQSGFPTVFWFDRLIAPTFTLWPVPDSTYSYTCNYYSCRQTQDTNLTGGQTVELPYRFLEAFTAGLAWKLSEMYAPAMEDKMFARYQRAWNIAATQDVENVPLYLIPGIEGYYRS